MHRSINQSQNTVKQTKYSKARKLICHTP